MEAYFYADDNMIASPRLEKLQRLFGVLIDLFGMFVFCMNVQKILSMAYRP